MYFNCFPFQLLSEIEEHLKCTITQCEPDIKVPLDEFDGKVTYGQRRTAVGECTVSLGCPVCVLPFIVSVIYLCIYFLSHTPGGLYKGHVDILAPTVQELANLEREAQTSFLQLCYLPNQLFKAF